MTDTIKISRLKQILSRMGKKPVIVLGDLMLDEYVWGNVSRISPEAPVPVVEVSSRTLKLGGAANVASNLKALGHPVSLYGLIGKDDRGASLLGLLRRAGIESEGILALPSAPTVTKTRILAHSQQVVRIDYEKPEELNGNLLEKLLSPLKKELSRAKFLIISDYGKGVITPPLLDGLLDFCRRKEIFVAVDPKETHFHEYRRVSVITPNHHEAGFAYGKRIRDHESLKEVAFGLMKKLEAESMLVTLGERGMSLFEGRKEHYFPARAKKVYDVTGAGDTVTAVFTSAVSAGATLPEAAYVSNRAAGLVIEELGTAQVTKKQLWNEIKSEL
ncbi:MAG: D-glycero-beta-D-manno-heptose-7-phosphate kinase [candidate division Zixibacteria bacterium]|nr:D-glycero-beta-D-manno-heptose-7-phosphate kinase [candidate division Zixibacteria bacterium]